MKIYNSSILFYVYTFISFLTGVGFIVKENYLYTLNLLSLYLGYIIILLMVKKMNIDIKMYIKFLIVLTLVLHSTFGQYFNLYYTNNWFDKILHIIGAFAFSQLFYYFITAFFKNKCKFRILVFISVFTLGVTLGVFFEIIEFTIDFLYKSKHQHGLIDTNLDLIFNMIGSCVSGFMISRQ